MAGDGDRREAVSIAEELLAKFAASSGNAGKRNITSKVGQRVLKHTRDTLKVVLRFAEPIVRKASQNAYRVLVNISLSSLTSRDILYKMHMMATSILLAAHVGISVEDEVVSYADKTLRLTSMLMAGMQLTGGYGETMPGNIGLVGRRTIVPYEVFDLMVELGIPEDDVRRVLALIEATSDATQRLTGDVAAVEVQETVVAFITEMMAKTVLPVLENIVSKIITQALEKIEIIMPVGVGDIMDAVREAGLQLAGDSDMHRSR